MRPHRYNVAVRKKGGTTREFDVESEYAQGWFIKVLKELIEKKEQGECNDLHGWVRRVHGRTESGAEITEQDASDA